MASPSGALSTISPTLAYIPEAVSAHIYALNYSTMTEHFDSSSIIISYRLAIHALLPHLSMKTSFTLTILLPKSSLRVWRICIVCRDERNELSVWRSMEEGKRFVSWSVKKMPLRSSSLTCRVLLGSGYSTFRMNLHFFLCFEPATCHFYHG